MGNTKTMKRFLMPVMLLISAGACADKVDDYVKSVMEKQHVPSIVIGIVKNGKLVREQAYGYSDLELQVRANKDNLYEIGSITKQFTATCAFMLIDQGKLSLEDPISKYLPDAPASWANIKIRNLLYQTSGLQDYALVEGIGLVDKFDRAKFMSVMSQKPLDFPPGMTWAYSNTNYALMGWIIEKIAGESYIKFVTDNILKPLGMTHTVFEDPDEIVTNRAHGYILDASGKMFRAQASSASINSDGTIMSNVEDMAKWDDALTRGKLLTPASYKLMYSPATLNSGRQRPYGTGWFLSQYKGVPYIGHGGNSSGYSAGFARYPEQHLSVILLSNVYAISGEAVAKSIAEIVEPSVRPTIPAVVADTDPARTERVKAALGKLGSGDPDQSLLEPDVSVLLNTARVKAFNPYALLKHIDKLEFAGAEPMGKDTLLTYRMASSGRTFTAFMLWSDTGKLANLVLRPDRPKLG